MPKVTAAWDTRIDLTPKGHAAAMFLIADERELDTICDPKTRTNPELLTAAHQAVRDLSGLMRWQGLTRADLQPIAEEPCQ